MERTEDRPLCLILFGISTLPHGSPKDWRSDRVRTGFGILRHVASSAFVNRWFCIGNEGALGRRTSSAAVVQHRVLDDEFLRTQPVLSSRTTKRANLPAFVFLTNWISMYSSPMSRTRTSPSSSTSAPSS